LEKEKYSVQDLVGSSSFRRMVKGSASSDEIKMWSEWMEKSEDNRKIAKIAMSEIIGFEFIGPKITDKTHEWEKLKSVTIEKKLTYRYRRETKGNRLNWIVKIAAVFILASLIGIGVFYKNINENSFTALEQVVEKVTIETGEGENKVLSFSNGAKVVINANSRITYSEGLLQNQPIDIRLEGEAWFETEGGTSKNRQVFEVITPNGIIKNIGTKFLVTVKDEYSRVVLQEGEVEVLSIRTNENGQTGEERFRISEGEMAEFNSTNIIRLINVNPTLYSSWATQFVEFKQTGMMEFAEYVEELFGVKVKINNANLKSITIDGAIYFRSLEELVRSVSEVTGIPIYQFEDTKTVYIGHE
jgi:ferric-dicitrate binding protein FerR (iron transport regulator)